MTSLRLTLLSVAAMAGAMAMPGAASAASFSVDTSSDLASPDCSAGHPAGTCSLRGAITAAGSGDVVSIAAGVNPVLTAGLITTTTTLTIQGQGARATAISGHGASGIFDVSSGGLAISGLTLTGANSTTIGAALDNEPGATTSLTDVAVRGNVVSGAGDGGGIANRGTLTLTRVTVSGNSGSTSAGTGGSAGGGIANTGSLTAVNSTITDNTQSGSGSGSVTGGGLYNAGTATLINVTIASNTVTATGTGAGSGGNITTVGVGASTTLENTLIAYGTAASGANCFTGSGGAAFATQGGNLESTTPSQCGLAGPPAGSDVIGADPLLAALADNGGQTDTRALSAGSPAIDAVPAANCPAPAEDQRLVARPQGPLCDIGAFESAAGSSSPGPSPLTPPSPVVTPPAPPPAHAVGCVADRLVLTDVFPLAGRTRLLGVAPAAAAGKRVTIVSAWDHKTVARPAVGADLTFSATVALPPRALRFTNRARYVAQFGSAHSLVLKFARRMYTTAITTAGATITFKGTVVPPLAKPAAPVIIRASTTCSGIGGGTIVATVKPSASGAFKALIRLPAAFDSARAAYLRAQTTVRKTKANPKPFPTFTLIRGITRGG